MPIFTSTKKRIVTLFAVGSLMILGGCGGGGGSTGAPGGGGQSAGNQAPTAQTDSATQNGLPLVIAVLSNDTDPNGDALSISSVGAAANGATVIDDNGTPGLSDDDVVVYTPNSGFLGGDTFTYVVSDDAGATATGTVNIVASPLPVALPDTVNVQPGTTSTIDVLSNDSDPNDLPLSLISVGSPGNGAAATNNNGTPGDPSDDFVTYTPNVGFQGPDSFAYSVTNGTDTVAATVSVTVSPDGGNQVAINGVVAKGPIENALIQVFTLSQTGEANEASPIAQTITDNLGEWSINLPEGQGDLLIVANSGVFFDESDSNPDLSQRRRIVLEPGNLLAAALPSGESRVAITPYSYALLQKSRSETEGGNFAEVYSNNRQRWTTSFGFDVVGVLPVNPDNPAQAQEPSQRIYTLALGGVANVLNDAASQFSEPLINYPLIQGFVADFSDCQLDGQTYGQVVQVDFDGVVSDFPSDLNLNAAILRFRNNNFSDFPNDSLVIDATECATPGQLPDTQAPEFENVPEPLTLAATTPQGISSADPAVQTQLLLATASDNRGGPVTISNNLPTVIPIGVTTVTLIAQDQSGNTATFPWLITVTDETPPTIQAPADIRIVAQGAQTTVALGAAVVSDNVTPEAELQVSNDAPATFPLGLTVVAWTVTDNAGLNGSDLQVITVVNDTSPTVVAAIPDQVSTQNQPFSLDGSANFSDPDGDALSYSVLGLVANSGLTIDSQTGVLSGTPNNVDAQASPQSLVIVASDGTSAASIGFGLTTTDVNDAPIVAAPVPDLNATEGQTFSTSVLNSFVDPDGDSLSFSLAGLPSGSGLSFDATAAVLSGVPNSADVNASPMTLTATAADPSALEVSDQFILSVANLNDAPSAIALSDSTIAENRPPSTAIGVLSTTDPDPGDTHVYELVAGVGDSDNAQFQIIGDTLRSAAQFDFETQNVFSVRIRSTDDGSPQLATEAQFVISVADVNDVPVITAQAAPITTVEETAVTITLGDLVVSDEDNVFPQDFTLAVQDGPNYSRNGNTITPVADFEGDLVVSVTVNDGTDSSNTFDLVVTVSGVNDRPVITGQQALATAIDQSLTLTLENFVVDDPDNAFPQDFSLSVGDGANYSRDANTITPAAGFIGNLTVPVSVNDGLLQSAVFDALVSVVGSADLSLMMSFDNAAPTPGNSVVLTLTISNAGPNQAAGIVVQGFEGTGYIHLGDDGGGSFDDQQGIWTVGTLGNGETAVLNITYRVNASGNFTLTSEVVASSQPDPDSTPDNGDMAEDDYASASTIPPGAKVDSDDDGLADSDETSIHSTDPGNPDSDGDGVGDGLEVGFGTDPNAAAGSGGVLFVSGDGNDSNSGEAGWSGALQTNAALGAQLSSGSPTEPVYVLYDQGTYDALGAEADHVVFVGGLGPDVYMPDPDASAVFDASTTQQPSVEVTSAVGVQFMGIDLVGGDVVSDGAGLRVLDSEVTFTDGRIEGNIAQGEGGGFYVDATSTLTLDRVLIRGNRSDESSNLFGGGAGSVRGGLTMRNTVLADNRQTAVGGQPGGGALYIENAAEVTISHSLFLSNRSAADGGAVLIQRINAPATFFNNLFVGNRNDTGFGGAFHAVSIDQGHTLDISSNTFAYNQTSGSSSGGGVDIWHSADQVTLDNNIVWFNNDSSVAVTNDDNLLIHSGSSATLSYSNVQLGSSTGSNGNISADPVFEAGFYLNQSTSGSVDTGWPSSGTLNLEPPFTTDVNGSEDINLVDQGFHHNGPGQVVNQLELVETVYNCSDDTLTLRVEPRLSGQPVGPGKLLATRQDAGSEANGNVNGLTTLAPWSWTSGVMAIDEGDGRYRVTVDNLVFNPGDTLTIETNVNNQSQYQLTTPALDQLAAAAGC